MQIPMRINNRILIVEISRDPIIPSFLSARSNLDLDSLLRDTGHENPIIRDLNFCPHQLHRQSRGNIFQSQPQADLALERFVIDQVEPI